MSKFCTNCGATIEEGQVCACQSAPKAAAPQPAPQPTPQPAPQPAQQQPVYNQQQNVQPSDNRKVYSVLSYIGILWLVGMFVNPEKDDPKVRFHVGQGIILTIVQIGLGIVNGILSGILTAIFIQKTTYYGYSYATGVSSIGALLMGLISFVVWAASIALAIIGIVNAANDKEKPLPIIGKLAFYK